MYLPQLAAVLQSVEPEATLQGGNKGAARIYYVLPTLPPSRALPQTPPQKVPYVPDPAKQSRVGIFSPLQHSQAPPAALKGVRRQTDRQTDR